MYEKILVPVDGSEASWHALGHACALGKRFGSKIIIVHVVEPYYTLSAEAIQAESVSLQQVSIAEVEAAGYKIIELATKKMNHCLNVCSINEPCYTLLPKDIQDESLPDSAISLEVEASDPNMPELAKQSMNPSPKFETLLKFGSPANTIISLAKEEDFNLIVIGSRGLSGLNEFILGSVSNKVSHAATVPVLIVK